ncbi:MAG: RNA-binding domain-containing protein, partial [Nitrososphaerales archaeon]
SNLMINSISLRSLESEQLDQELIFQEGEISFFAHATEDLEKLVEGVSVRLNIPIETFERTKGEGHFGNPIQINRAHFGHEESEALVKKIVGEIETEEKVTLGHEIDNHIDSKGTLYLRLDKQELMLGRLTLGEKDPIRIKIKLKISTGRRELNIQAFRKLLME